MLAWLPSSQRMKPPSKPARFSLAGMDGNRTHLGRLAPPHKRFGSLLAQCPLTSTAVQLISEVLPQSTFRSSVVRSRLRAWLSTWLSWLPLWRFSGSVADGAGGTEVAGHAAETVIREITGSASLEHDSASWCDILRQTDFRVGVGESTCVVVARSLKGIVGASVGDSKAWLIENDDLNDLTRSQVRKPLLGSGEAQPVGFEYPSLQGLLLVCTDGFCNYVRRDTLLRNVLWFDFAVLAHKLVEMVRLPSGELWDDIGIVACRPRRTERSRKRYEITDLD